MKKNLIYALLCVIVSLVGCDKLKEATSHDFTVKNISLDFEADVDEGPSTSPGNNMGLSMRAGMNSFSVTRTVDISEMGSSELVTYANKINNAVVNAASLSVTTTPSGTYSVANLKITAVGVSGELVIPSYTIGGSFTAPSNMNTYTTAFILQLVSTKSISVTVTGQTDAPAGTTVNISYESEVLFTASIL